MEPQIKKVVTRLYNDNFQNFKRYGIPKAQLVIADIPYNIGTNFYGSNPMWYNGGDRKKWRKQACREGSVLIGL